MKPPELKRFNEGDYPGAPTWFSGFIAVLNRFMEQVFAIMNRNTTIGDNVPGRYFTTTFKARAGYAAGEFVPISISWPFSERPNAVMIAQIATSNGAKILDATSLQWVLGSNGISIIYVAGLTAGVEYTITFLCL